jgi:hypothetical protein
LKIFALILGLEFLIPKSSLLCAKKKIRGEERSIQKDKKCTGKCQPGKMIGKDYQELYRQPARMWLQNPVGKSWQNFLYYQSPYSSISSKWMN